MGSRGQDRCRHGQTRVEGCSFCLVGSSRADGDVVEGGPSQTISADVSRVRQDFETGNDSQGKFYFEKERLKESSLT